MKRDGEVSAGSVGAAVGAGIGYLVGPTAIIGPPLGLFLLPTSVHFGLSRSGVNLLMCVTATLVGVTSPIAGRLIDRYGVRRVVLPSVLLFGLAEAGLGVSGASFALYAAVYAIVGVLAGIQNPIAYTKVVSIWFNRHRGLVLALSGAIGGGGGGVLVPQIADALIRRGGWQLGYIGLGGFIIALGMPSLFLLLREPRVREPRMREPGAAAVLVRRAPDAIALPGLNRAEAMRTTTFWAVLAIVTLAAGSVMSIGVHLPALLATRAPGSHLPALFLSLFALGSVLGQFGTGTCLDRVNSPKVGVPFLAVAAIGAMLLWRGGGPEAALPGGLLTGCGFGAELGLACYYVSRFFGLRAYGQIYGFIYGVTVAASAFGPFLMGYSFDQRGSYDLALAVICAALCVSTALVFMLPPYRFKPPADVPAMDAPPPLSGVVHADPHR